MKRIDNNIYWIIWLLIVVEYGDCRAKSHETKKPKAKFENPNGDQLDGQILHGDPNFHHKNATVDVHKKLNLNLSEPSLKELEKELKIPGHQFKNEHRPYGLNDTQPSVDKIEEKIKIAGHENNKHHDAKNHTLDQPSLDLAEKIIKIDGHENDDKTSSKKRGNMQPSNDFLFGTAPRRSVKARRTNKLKNKGHAEPSIEILEQQISVNKSDRAGHGNRPNRSDILPSYEGFQGVLMGGDETFQVKANKSKHTPKPADMDDFRSWLKTEEKKSKLSRFKKLKEELTDMEKRIYDGRSKQSHTTSSSVGSVAYVHGKRENFKERLDMVIRELEREEELRKKKIKTDL